MLGRDQRVFRRRRSRAAGAIGDWARAATAANAVRINTRIVTLLVADGLDRIEFGGLHRRINSEQQADADRHAEGDRDGGRGDIRRPAGRRRDDLRQREAEHNSDQAADDRDQHRFRQELTNDVGLACADGAADSDFAGTLEHGGQHDVHDADTADQQRDAGDTDHDDAEDELRPPLLLQQAGGNGDVEIARVLVRGGQNGADDVRGLDRIDVRASL